MQPWESALTEAARVGILPVIVLNLEVPHMGDAAYACIIWSPFRRKLSMFGRPLPSLSGKGSDRSGLSGVFGGGVHSSKNLKSSGCRMRMFGLVVVVVVVVVVIVVAVVVVNKDRRQ